MTDNTEHALLRQLANDVAVVKSTVERIEKRDDDTEHRLRKVERWQWITAGVAVASVGGSVAALVNAIPTV